MKYAIIIPDGCADEPQEALHGKTPLQAARTPNMDRIAQAGVVGRTNNVPASLTPASDVATLSLFGYDPLEVYTGRAPLEAAALGVLLGPNDWAIRCNLVAIEDGRMRDFTAGHIAPDDARELLRVLADGLETNDRRNLEFYPGVSYRNLLVCRGDESGPFSDRTKTQPPHDIPDQPIADHLPTGDGADLLRSVMERSRDIFRNHPVNQAIRERGGRPADQVWLWGQGRVPKLELFHRRFGKRGAIISAVDLVRGVGILLGWTRIDVPGATGYLDTDYEAKGRTAVAALASHDLVCVHIEAPDEASHEGRPDAKVDALEEIDTHIVGPLLDALPGYDQWRILVVPDHCTHLRTRAHAHGEVPLALAGTGIPPGQHSSYDEETAATSRLAFEKGHELMPRFLNEQEEIK